MVTTISRPESIQTISEESRISPEFKVVPEQTSEIKREILQNLEDSPEEILDDLGGAALDRVFPEITSDSIKPADVEKLTKHFVFRDGITVTPATKTIFIPKQTREGVVQHFLTTDFGKIKDAAENGSLYSMEIAISPNVIPNRFTEAQRASLDEGEGKDGTGDIFQGHASYKLIKADPKTGKGPEWGESITGISLVEPEPPPEPESGSEFYIQSVMREGQFPQITSNESNLSTEYLAKLGRAIKEESPEELLRNWNPRLLSPDLVILELKNGKKRLVFAQDPKLTWWHKEMFDTSPKESDTGTQINRWLHTLQVGEGRGRKRFDVTSNKSL